jgi:hypothetical protein
MARRWKQINVLIFHGWVISSNLSEAKILKAAGYTARWVLNIKWMVHGPKKDT